MTPTLLRDADPAAGIDPDPASPAARAMLRDILAAPRPTSQRAAARPKVLGRIVIGGALTGAAAIAVVVAVSPAPDHQLGQAAYEVTRSADGTVRAVMRWSMLSDPTALQQALDRAHARMKVFVETDTPSLKLCAQPHTTPYSADAVEWHSPTDADAENGIVLHPDRFPKHGTFVLVVTMVAPGSTRGSTFAPGFPPIAGTLSYMAIGPVLDPAC